MISIKMNQFIKGAFLLTLIGIVSKVLSAFYRIPIQNVTGDLGFYTYQQVYPFIATLMILSLYSFPAAVSKVGAQISEENRTVKQFLLPNFIILLFINGSLFIIVYILAPYIAMLSGNIALRRAYELIAFAFLIVPFLATGRGFFQSSGEMKQTAYSQLVEQTIRVTIIVTACFLIYYYQLQVFKIGIYGSVATLISMMLAVIVLSIFLLRKRQTVNFSNPSDNIPWKYYWQTLVIFGLVFALNHMAFIFIQFADVFSLIPTLVKHGLVTNVAMTSKGIYDRAIPLIQLGVVIGSSFAVALIPMMTGRHTDIEKVATIQQALSLCIYISAGATAGLVVLFPEINLLLFKSIEETVSLRLFSFVTILLALMMTVNPILQTMGKHWQSVIYIGLAFIVKILLNFLLVPKYGLIGASLATIMTVALLVIVQLAQLKKLLPGHNLFSNLKWKQLTLALSVMILYLIIWKWVIPFNMMPRTWLFGYVIFLVGTGALIYLFFLLINRAFSESQIRALPFSTVIFALLEKFIKKDKLEGDKNE